ncbi:hypothetical protein BDW60DRAFT_209386 [Aspergillus nidulans var. acristatus]
MRGYQIFPHEYILPDAGNISFPVCQEEVLSQAPSQDNIQPPYTTPVSSVANRDVDPPPEVHQFSGVPLDNDGLDKLFKELVPSIPTRLEPEFAQNLGFDAGDLDPDFMTHLQQRPYE